MFFLFRKSPKYNASVGEIKDVALRLAVFLNKEMGAVAEELSCSKRLERLKKAGDVVRGGGTVGGTSHFGDYIRTSLKREGRGSFQQKVTNLSLFSEEK